MTIFIAPKKNLSSSADISVGCDATLGQTSISSLDVIYILLFIFSYILKNYLIFGIWLQKIFFVDFEVAVAHSLLSQDSVVHKRPLSFSAILAVRPYAEARREPYKTETFLE